MPDEVKASGLDNDYWVVEIKHPRRLGAPYKVEAEDLIEAMGMPFAEATVFKSLWRLMQLRAGRGKPGSTEKYEGEKMVYYSGRTLAKILNHQIVEMAERPYTPIIIERRDRFKATIPDDFQPLGLIDLLKGFFRK